MIISPSKIEGEINISGAKNAVLKHLTASILNDEEVILCNYPQKMLDVEIHEEMLTILGKKIVKGKNKISISGKISTSELHWSKRSIRNTLLMLGVLLTKTGYAKVPLPGGCSLGERKYDIHIDLIKAMGGIVWEDEKYLYAKSKKEHLYGCDFFLPIRSTGATENGILMGCLAKGTTRIWNPHIRPEIIDLILFLRKMGAKIDIRGQESIIIEGVDKLNGVEHVALSDNMQALTYLMAGAIAGKELHLKNFPFKDLEIPLIFLKFSGLKYFEYENELIVKQCIPLPIDISTGPYPGINSDMQPLFAVWGALAYGISTITDLRFYGRYQYADEFKKMGVFSSIVDNRLQIKGTENIYGSEVDAIDLRAGAALVLLALIAKTPTTINNFWMIERGYDNFKKNLENIGVTMKYE